MTAPTIPSAKAEKGRAHTPGPWRIQPDERASGAVEICVVESFEHDAIDIIADAVGHNDDPLPNARRIVACVNICEGMSTEALEWLAVRPVDLVEALRGMVAIHDSVTQGQERELIAKWLPIARAALSSLTPPSGREP